jgi:membrane associated rhomboid family serine protease
VFPIRDDNPHFSTPYATYGLIALNVLSWVLLQGLGSEPALSSSVCRLGLIPADVLGTVPPGTSFPISPDAACVLEGGGSWHTVLTSMFLHGGWMHLIGNMWFLWLFGNNIEDSMTRPRYVAFYLLTGIAAALAQVFAEPSSEIPMVGASGAISGVMGAYLVLFPRIRVYTLIPLGFFITSMALPAWAMLIYWAFLQFAGGLTSVVDEQGGGVAFWAHLGGFVAGVVLVKVFERRDRVLAHMARHWRPQNEWR